MAKISIIIPNYNHGVFLKDRIESILNQTFLDFEIIILDDCSSDNSKEIIESYRGHEKITHIEYNTINSGNTFKQWRKGIELAKGEWIWIAESDDVADHRFLSSLIQHTGNGISLVFSKSRIINELGDEDEFLEDKFFPNENCATGFSEKSHEFESKEFITHSLYRFNQIVNASSVIFLKQNAPTNDNKLLKFRLCGDWYFWIQLLERGNGYFVNEELNYFRKHSKSVRESSEAKIFTYFENALIVKHILSVYSVGNDLKNKYKDYLIYVYFNRYSKKERKKSFIPFLKTLIPFGVLSMLQGIFYRLKND